MIETKGISFVTKKAILTSSLSLGIPLNGTVVMANALVVEYQIQDNQNSRYSPPDTFKVVSLGDGRKLVRSYVLHLHGMSAVALTEITDEDNLA